MLRHVLRRTRAAPLRLSRGASGGGAPSLAAQLVAYAQGRVAAGAHAEADSVLEHGLTMASASGGADEHACIHMALAATAADRGRFASAAQRYEEAARAAISPDVTLAALCAAATLHSAAGAVDAALDAATRSAVHGGSFGARVAAAGARGLALHAAGRARAAGDAYGAVMAVDAPLSAAAKEAHGATVAGALYSAAAWQHCSSDASGSARGLFNAAAALSRDCTAAAASAAAAAPAPLLLSAAAAAEIEADAELGLAQLALCVGDADAAERHCATALRLAEALSGAAHPRVGVVLAVTADATMARLAAAARGAAGGLLADSDGVYVAEALYRRALQLVGTGAESAALAALLQLRLAEVLRVAGPNRASEAERLAAAAAAAGATGALVTRPWTKAAAGAPRTLLSLRLRRAFTGTDA